jgi:DNA-binding GntR family transcriptional regulator
MAQTGTRAERAYQQIRSDILTGHFLPGQRLLFTDLGSRYGTSVGVLREGLSRLAEQGLVVSQPQQGFHVTPVIPQDLQDLTEARVEIETLTFRKAMQSGDLAWESRLVAAHHVLDGTPELTADDPQQVNEAWAIAHTEFHRVLLEGCPNRRLREIAAALRDASEVYRRWSRHLGGEQGRDIPGEHRALLKAAIDRDIPGGTALLARHIEYTTNAVLASGQFSADGADSAPRDRRTSAGAGRDEAGGRNSGGGGKSVAGTKRSGRAATADGSAAGSVKTANADDKVVSAAGHSGSASRRSR